MVDFFCEKRNSRIFLCILKHRGRLSHGPISHHILKYISTIDFSYFFFYFFSGLRSRKCKRRCGLFCRGSISWPISRPNQDPQLLWGRHGSATNDGRSNGKNFAKSLTNIELVIVWKFFHVIQFYEKNFFFEYFNVFPNVPFHEIFNIFFNSRTII